MSVTSYWKIENKNYKEYYNVADDFIYAVVKNCPAGTKEIAPNSMRLANSGAAQMMYNVLNDCYPFKCNSVFEDLNEDEKTEMRNRYPSYDAAQSYAFRFDYEAFIDNENFTLGMFRYVFSMNDRKNKGQVLIHRMTPNGDDLQNDIYKNAVKKYITDSGITKVSNEGKTRLVLVIDFEKDSVIQGISSSGPDTLDAKAQSRAVSAKTTSRVKMAVASAHSRGGDFKSARVIASGLPSGHPLREAVMSLKVGSSVSAVERVLDMAHTSDHALAELESVVSDDHQAPSHVQDIYPLGTAMRMAVKHGDGKVSARIADLF